jgi:NodT family efflux transporter outer membrane factor (OMF) lipoprotein
LLADRPRESSTTEAAGDLRQWWADFHDPILSSLIERSIAANLDLQLAVLRIEEARAQRDVASSAYWPSISANASYARTELSRTTPTGALFNSLGASKTPGLSGISIPNPYNQFQLGAGVSWELDLFGRVRRSVEVADANIQESVEDQHATLVALLGDVAQNYIELRGAQLRLSVAGQNIDSITELLELTRKRRAAGLVSEVDVVQASAQLDSTRAQVPALQLAINQAINQLSQLLGLAPQSLRAELESTAAIPPLPPEVPIGLPADLARRRPDIRRAEASLHAATAGIGVAVAGLYPSITLTAGGGFQSETAGELAHWASRFGSFGPTLDLPVFDLGKWRTVRVQDVRAKEAAVAYAATVLKALHEVEDARAAYDADQNRHAWLDSTVKQNRDAWTLQRERYESGVASFIEVLDARRTLEQSELSLAESNTAVGDDLVRLYRALGGGWEYTDH